MTFPTLPPNSSVAVRPPQGTPFDREVADLHRAAGQVEPLKMASLCAGAALRAAHHHGPTRAERLAMMRWLFAHGSQWLDLAERELAPAHKEAAE